MYKNRSIVVVMPVHNEAALISKTLAKLPSYIDHVVVVDDAGTDGTHEILTNLAQDFPIPLTPLRHESNRGVGAATVTGYREALRTDTDIVVVMDGDGQMDVQDLPSLLDTVIDGQADFAKGNRFAHASIREMPLTRRIGNTIFSRLTTLALGLGELVDSQCGFTAFRADALRRLDLDALFPRYGFPNDILFQAIEKGLRFKSVPVRTIYGDEVSGINPLVVVPTIFGLIARGWWRRLGRRWTPADGQFPPAHTDGSGLAPNNRKSLF